MNQATLRGKLLSPAGFGLVLLCFFLPFVAVSCGPSNDHLTATFTGLTMVSGSRPQITGTNLNADDIETVHALVGDQYDLEPLALFSALLIMAAMASALIKHARARHRVSASLALAAFALLVGAVLRAEYRLEHFQGSRFVGADAVPEPGIATTRYGFWLAAALLVLLAVGHGIAFVRAPKAEPGTAVPAPTEDEPDFDSGLLFDDDPPGS